MKTPETKCMATCIDSGLEEKGLADRALEVVETETVVGGQCGRSAFSASLVNSTNGGSVLFPQGLLKPFSLV